MSMRDCPGSGYILPLAAILPLVPNPEGEDFLGFSDQETFEWLDENWPADLPTIQSVWTPGDEDGPGDNMVAGTTYVIFDEDSLYTKVPTPALLQLQEKGLKPEWDQWTDFG